MPSNDRAIPTTPDAEAGTSRAGGASAGDELAGSTVGRSAVGRSPEADAIAGGVALGAGLGAGRGTARTAPAPVPVQGADTGAGAAGATTAAVTRIADVADAGVRVAASAELWPADVWLSAAASADGAAELLGMATAATRPPETVAIAETRAVLWPAARAMTRISSNGLYGVALRCRPRALCWDIDWDLSTPMRSAAGMGRTAEVPGLVVRPVS
ncbi:MAG: hypothetical protein ACRCXL_05650 [Dermatophilaceae bacterium]